MIDCIIIGAGPAGIAAAVQATRLGLNVVVFEKSHIGGLIRNASWIENYPPYFTGISGENFALKLAAYALKFNIKILKDCVVFADYNDSKFIVKTINNNYLSTSLIVASGTNYKKPDIAISDELSDRVFYEITELKNTVHKHITIIGSGDAAFDYAVTLSKQNTVTILNRSENEKCLPDLYNKVLKIKTIKYVNNFIVKEIKSKNAYIEISSDKNENQECDFIVFAIGRHPEDSFLSENLRKNCNNIPAFKKAGDVKNDIFRQCSIAIGDGVKSAMEIYEHIKGVHCENNFQNW